MASTLMGIITGMALSLGAAILMERMLFRGLLKLMFAGPRFVRRTLEPGRGDLEAMRKAGM
ncbi:MAG TPA: hypothetical protein VK699_18880 [Terriglobales bacterium]|jgi:hypothetical protein|nr:hypothetical protein [Terriglobales bacterium]